MPIYKKQLIDGLEYSKQKLKQKHYNHNKTNY